MKALFFDIDGTLVDGRNGMPDIPQGVLNEFERLHKLGHKLFISSGRPKAMVDSKFLNIGFDGYILANGGYVEVDGQSIYEDRMDYELTKNTIDMLDYLHCDYMIETSDHIYIDPNHKVLFNFFNDLGHGDIFTFDFDKEDVMHRTIKIEMNVSNKDKQRVEDYIQNNFGYVINFDEHGSENSFEIYSPTISKAVGIQKILDHFGLCKEDSYAFGDGVNDLEMIEYVGTGVAMGNAVQPLKDVADIVCDSIHNNGLEKILKELF